MEEHAPADFSALVHRVGGVPVAEIYGELDLATVPKLLEAVGRAGSQLDGRLLVVVDLRGARFIDVSATRKLIEQSRAMREVGGEMRIVCPEHGPVSRVLELIGVEDEIGLYHTLDLR